MKNILFISHDTTRTGAPLVLLIFLKWVKKNHPEVKTALLALEGGALTADFKQEVDEFFLLDRNAGPASFGKRVGSFLARKAQIFYKKSTLGKNLLEILAQKEFDVIYSNTVVAVPVATKIKALTPEAILVAHVHELNSVIKTRVPNFADFLNNIDFVFTASEMVSNNLRRSYNFPENKMKTVYEFTESRQKLQEKEKGDFIVGASGWVYWRKGPDVFIQVARFIKSHFPDRRIKFVWVGNIGEEQKTIIDADLEKCGLDHMVDFVGEMENPDNQFSSFDIFLLTSREDPFPLVCIESAMMATPIICFEGASGTSEILEKGGGYIVPYLDIEAMAGKIIFYYDNKKEIEKDGIRAKELFSGFTPDNIAPVIFQKLIDLTKKGDAFKKDSLS